MCHKRFMNWVTIWVRYIYWNGLKRAGLITASDQTVGGGGGGCIVAIAGGGGDA